MTGQGMTQSKPSHARHRLLIAVLAVAVLGAAGCQADRSTSAETTMADAEVTAVAVEDVPAEQVPYSFDGTGLYFWVDAPTEPSVAALPVVMETLDGGIADTLRLIYYDPEVWDWTWVPSALDKETGVVTAEVPHTGLYSILLAQREPSPDVAALQAEICTATTGAEIAAAREICQRIRCAAPSSEMSTPRGPAGGMDLCQFCLTPRPRQPRPLECYVRPAIVPPTVTPTYPRPQPGPAPAETGCLTQQIEMIGPGYECANHYHLFDLASPVANEAWLVTSVEIKDPQRIFLYEVGLYSRAPGKVPGSTSVGDWSARSKPPHLSSTHRVVKQFDFHKNSTGIRLPGPAIRDPRRQVDFYLFKKWPGNVNDDLYAPCRKPITVEICYRKRVVP